MDRKKLVLGIGLLMVLIMPVVLTQCAPAPTLAPTAVPTVAPAPTLAPIAVPTATEQPKYKMAVILPGPVTDGDFNMFGMLMANAIGKQYGIETGYSENTSVADSERVAREYIGSGFNIIYLHGGQYVTTVSDLAKEFPNVYFMEVTAGPTDALQQPNIWNLGERTYLGHYPMGVMAAKMTKTAMIGFLAGVELPAFISSINTICDAIKATNPNVKLVYAFTGDQNDPVKARQSAQAMIDGGADFIIGAVNQGIFGVIEAVRAADKPVFFTTLYSEKYDLAPNNYVTSEIVDYQKVGVEVVGQIMGGVHGGYYDLRPGHGMTLGPFQNVPPDVAKDVQSVVDQISSGQLNPEDKPQEILCGNGK